ncbi:MAG: aromatic ring-hydroxylating oxygenase subunit alpha [Pseudomonadales bacterium]
MQDDKTTSFADLVPKPWVQEVYLDDTIAPPPGLRNTSAEDMSSADIPVERYLSYEWHRQEVEHVWKKTWQVACRVEEIPDPGDHVVYDIVDDSVIVVRTKAGEIIALTNSCLHRGTTLADDYGHKDCFRCPYHGWQYDLEGKLEFVPGDWDFSHLPLKDLTLPKVQIGFWAGFVFINLDPNCKPLADYLGVLPDHLDDFNIDDRYKAVHVSQVVPCNWKAAQEAFIEGYHVAQTHYDKDASGHIAAKGAAATNLDTSIQYDYWSPHVTRLIMVGGLPSGYVAKDLPDEQAIADAYFGRRPGNAVKLQPGQTAREAIVQHNRNIWSDMHNRDLSTVSDAEMIDQIQYTLFPNFTVWPTIVAPLIYRFRPNGDDPESAIYEIWMLFPKSDDGTHPEPMQDKRLGPNEPWASVKELGSYGPVIDQDTPNFPRIQKGMKASQKKAISLANYQESRIRAFHETLEQYLEGEFS